MAYIDPSVLAAYYCPEPRSDRVQRVLAGLDARVISPLVEVELCSAVAAKVRTRELDATSGRRVLELFRQHLADGAFGVVPVGAAQYRLAGDWLGGFKSALRALDALHLATASAHDLPILTADRALAKAAQVYGVRHQLLR